MKAITLNLILTFITSYSFAGGFDISGNGRSYLQMSQDSVANNAAARMAYSSSVYCSNARGRIASRLPSKGFMVKLQDQQANLLMIPLDNTLIEQEGNIEKRKLTYLATRNGQLVVETAVLTINNQYKHENVLNIQWTTPSGTTVKVARFIPVDSVAVYGDIKEVSEFGVRCDVHKTLQASEETQALFQNSEITPTEERKLEVDEAESAVLSSQEEISVEQDVEEVITEEPTTTY